MRQFNESMAQVSTMLSGERQELRASLRNLAVAMGEVSTFVKDNRAILGRNIEGLNRVARVLVKQRGALDQILSSAPLALNNLYMTYNPQAGTLDTRSNQGETEGQIVADPEAFLCGIAGQVDDSGEFCDADQAGRLPAAGRLRPGRRGLAGAVRPDPGRPRGGAAMNALKRRFKALLLLVAASVLLSGCDFDVYELPLPGGTDVGDNPITVTVMFDDVLDLVPKSTVKVNDVSVGNVSDVQLDGYVAEVTLELQDDVELPDDAIAQIRQTSLLGEKFVSLSPPPEGGEQRAPRERRRDPARAQRPQPRGRGSPRRPQPAPQRRRRGPAADHQPRAQQRPSRAARTPPGRCSARSRS